MNTNESSLTARQMEVLNFVREWRSRKGKMPSTREIQRHFGFSSQTAAVNHRRNRQQALGFVGYTGFVTADEPENQHDGGETDRY